MTSGRVRDSVPEWTPRPSKVGHGRVPRRGVLSGSFVEEKGEEGGVVGVVCRRVGPLRVQGLGRRPGPGVTVCLWGVPVGVMLPRYANVLPGRRPGSHLGSVVVGRQPGPTTGVLYPPCVGRGPRRPSNPIEVILGPRRPRVDGRGGAVVVTGHVRLSPGPVCPTAPSLTKGAHDGRTPPFGPTAHPG